MSSSPNVEIVTVLVQCLLIKVLVLSKWEGGNVAFNYPRLVQCLIIKVLVLSKWEGEKRDFWSLGSWFDDFVEVLALSKWGGELIFFLIRGQQSTVFPQNCIKRPKKLSIFPKKITQAIFQSGLHHSLKIPLKLN